MALMKGKEVPKDAIALDESEATEYVWKLVDDWNNSSDVWALRYAPFVLGAVNGAAGLLINRFYRQKLKLGTYGYFSSVLPITAMPALLTALFHRRLVSTDMLLMKSQGCAICYELRSAAVQVSLGVGYPMILGPLSAVLFANRYSTTRLPDHSPKAMFHFLRKITRPFSSTLTLLLVGQVALSSIFTYFELKNDFTLRRKITQIEAQLMADQNES